MIDGVRWSAEMIAGSVLLSAFLAAAVATVDQASRLAAR